MSLIFGGKMLDCLNSELNRRDYALGKAYVWLCWLRKECEPTRWEKVSKEGTYVDFRGISSWKGQKKAWMKLESFVRAIHSHYESEHFDDWDLMMGLIKDYVLEKRRLVMECKTREEFKDASQIVDKKFVDEFEEEGECISIYDEPWGVLVNGRRK